MKYLIILHMWFVDSKGFELYESDAQTFKQAEEEAKALSYDRGATFNKCAYKIIQLTNKERLRKLTWKERILGRLDK